MEQFDVAHVLYREEPLGLFYLSHDPVEAAHQLCDVHVRKGIEHCATMLANAWHTLNPNYNDIDAPETRVGRMFRGCSSVPPYPDPGYLHWSGNSLHWLLAGQRIPRRTHEEHPSSIWAGGLGGNYRWVHSHGLALADEHVLRFGRPHWARAYLWTLEGVPPHLRDTLEQQTEPAPAVPNPVVVDGFYDTIASYRLHYVADKQPLLQWSVRQPPSWLQLVKGVYELA